MAGYKEESDWEFSNFEGLLREAHGGELPEIMPLQEGEELFSITSFDGKNQTNLAKTPGSPVYRFLSITPVNESDDNV